jgi:hypothetical protein
MICENCKQKINEEEEYYKVIHYLKRESINEKFVHRDCQNKWEENVKEQFVTNKMAQEFMGRAKHFMKNMGVEEVINI